MTDETPLDLRTLDAGEPPDEATRAVRRFRVRVVLFTVASVVTASVVVGAAVAWVAKERPQTAAVGWTPAQTAILNDLVGICQTPTYTFGELEVGVLGGTAMPDGGYALHLAVHGRVAEQLEDGNGGAYLKTTNFFVAGEAAPRASRVAAQPGNTWGEAYVEVPAGIGPEIEVIVRGPALDEPESFTVDTEQLRRGC